MAPSTAIAPASTDAGAVLAALVALDAPYSPPVTGGLSDSELLDRQRELAEGERRVTAGLAALAAENMDDGFVNEHAR